MCKGCSYFCQQNYTIFYTLLSKFGRVRAHSEFRVFDRVHYYQYTNIQIGQHMHIQSCIQTYTQTRIVISIFASRQKLYSYQNYCYYYYELIPKYITFLTLLQVTSTKMKVLYSPKTNQQMTKYEVITKKIIKLIGMQVAFTYTHKDTTQNSQKIKVYPYHQTNNLPRRNQYVIVYTIIPNIKLTKLNACNFFITSVRYKSSPKRKTTISKQIQIAHSNSRQRSIQAKLNRQVAKFDVSHLLLLQSIKLVYLSLLISREITTQYPEKKISNVNSQ
eukprot:TRINITY_DN20958_c0_g4_i3.p1 TRINITY_DN20958_c0_g4~~TRINITY_DN20958_c0_g4_i3.p1  ORF type:complete len:275 (+),score=-30.58 TRINITY_DN20958_c0_g4_i3:539-1363(+)